MRLPLVLCTRVALVLAVCSFTAAAQTPKVGPPRGSVMVVGGGSMGPELYAKFIELAGGPDALIIDVPTAGGDSVYPANWQGTRGLKAAGATNVIVLHTIDRKLADSDSFVAPITRAGAVWFEGGRQWHLVDSYAGTRTEKAFHDVLARGGIVGGSSAGASILSSYLLRGAPSGNTIIMAPGYEQGFAFLRGVAIDQHVVARERLPDLADSLMPRRPELLGVSEDEGTAWLVQGDTAVIIGRNKAFVYGGKDPTDPNVPFLTLHPGDTYNLATRRVIRRAIEDTPLAERFVDDLLAPLARSGATVLVAQNGKVLVNKAYGIPPQARYMPPTTVPNFPLAGLSNVVHALTAQLVVRDAKISLDDALAGGVTIRQYLSGQSAPGVKKAFADLIAARDLRPATGRGGGAGGATAGTPYNQVLNRRIYTPIGAHKTVVDPDGEVQSSVDELYRLALGLESPRTFARDTTSSASGGDGPPIDVAFGWRADTYKGAQRLSQFGSPGGKRHAFVRFPDRRTTIIILTNDANANVAGVADQIADRLLFTKQ